MRSWDEPLDAWRCCEHWQRTLSNKLNGHAFARRHGCRVPETYWVGRWPGRIPWHRIPEEFVVKPLWGISSRGAYVLSGGRERLTDVPMTRDELRRALKPGTRPIRWIPLTVQEHVRRPNGEHRYALEFRFHVFRDVIEAVTVANQAKQIACYSGTWAPLPYPLLADRVPFEIAPPDCVEEMRELSLRIGKTYGSYCRVDMFWTDKGCVFNELAGIPLAGVGFTPFADEFLGDCWERMLQRHA